MLCMYVELGCLDESSKLAYCVGAYVVELSSGYFISLKNLVVHVCLYVCVHYDSM